MTAAALIVLALALILGMAAFPWFLAVAPESSVGQRLFVGVLVGFVVLIAALAP